MLVLIISCQETGAFKGHEGETSVEEGGMGHGVLVPDERQGYQKGKILQYNHFSSES